MKQFFQRAFSLSANKIYSFLVEVNVLEHLLNKKHSQTHRMFFGLVIGYTGVLIAKAAGHSHFEGLAQIGDGMGYFLHGLGITPFIDKIGRAHV